MWRVPVCLCLVLLSTWRAQGQRTRPDRGAQTDTVAVDAVDRGDGGALDVSFPPELRAAPRVPRRAQQGPRFALSLDVPTSILSVLIDLAKNQDMRTKAAANAELMARVG